MTDFLTRLPFAFRAFGQEEGGIPEAHFSLHSLEEALVQAESISLLRDGDQSQGLGHALWSQAGASASLGVSSLLALCLVVQGSTLMEQQGKGGGGEEGDNNTPNASVDKLREMARDASKHQVRCSVRVANVNDVVPATSSVDGGVDAQEAMTSLESLLKDFTTVSQGLFDNLNAVSSGANLQQAEMVIVKAAQEWSASLSRLKPNSIRLVDGSDALFAAVGPSGLPQEARAMKVKKKLIDAMEMGPLLDATKESERRLAQVCMYVEPSHPSPLPTCLLSARPHHV